MTSLLPFFLNTLELRAGDPAVDRFFLPKVLTELPGDNSQGKLLPIEEDHWEIGAITGDAGEIVSSLVSANWSSYLEDGEGMNITGQHVVPNPSSPDPILNMGNETTKIVVTGLTNVKLSSRPTYTEIEDGYQVDLTMIFDHWDGDEGRPDYPRLGLSGPYRMTQALCLANSDSAECNGNASTVIDGSGQIDLTLENAALDMTVWVTAKRSGGAFQGLTVDIRSLNLRGAAPGSVPNVSVQGISILSDMHPLIKKSWREAVTQAIVSPDGSRAVVTNINTAMNDPTTRASVSKEASQNTAKVVDGLFGAVSGQLVPSQPGPGVNPADRYLFDRTRYALNNPKSDIFLPAVLAQSDTPSLSPLDVPKIDLPDIDVSTFLKFVKNKMTKLHVTGLTNVKAAESDLNLQGNKMVFRAALGAWNPPPAIGGGKSIAPPPATGAADFSITAQADGSEVVGKIGLLVRNVNLEGVVEAYGDADGDLRLEITKMALTTSNVKNSIQVEVKIDAWLKDTINQVANSSETLNEILGALNDEFKKNLKGISKDVTEYARAAIASELN